MSGQTAGMRCPVDGAQLVMSERSGIEIDYCPTWRGVWLDRGEFDKIIERNCHGPAPHRSRWRRPGPSTAGYGQPKRRKSFLVQIFD